MPGSCAIRRCPPSSRWPSSWAISGPKASRSTRAGTSRVPICLRCGAPWVFNAVKQAGGKVSFTGNRSFIPGKEGKVEWLHVHAGVVVSGKMLKENPNTLKAILRALKKATDALNTNREAAVKFVAKEMKMDEGRG